MSRNKTGQSKPEIYEEGLERLRKATSDSAEAARLSVEIQRLENLLLEKTSRIASEQAAILGLRQAQKTLQEAVRQMGALLFSLNVEWEKLASPLVRRTLSEAMGVRQDGLVRQDFVRHEPFSMNQIDERLINYAQVGYLKAEDLKKQYLRFAKENWDSRTIDHYRA